MDREFNYTYSAPEQEELKRIKEKYLPKEARLDKMEQLRRLDRSVERPGMILSLGMGVIGTLIFGAGMSCVMVWNLLGLGIAVGLAGVALLSAAYPVYKTVTEKRKAALAPQILALTEELMK